MLRVGRVEGLAPGARGIEGRIDVRAEGLPVVGLVVELVVPHAAARGRSERRHQVRDPVAHERRVEHARALVDHLLLRGAERLAAGGDGGAAGAVGRPRVRRRHARDPPGDGDRHQRVGMLGDVVVDELVRAGRERRIGRGGREPPLVVRAVPVGARVGDVDLPVVRAGGVAAPAVERRDLHRVVAGERDAVDPGGDGRPLGVRVDDDARRARGGDAGLRRPAELGGRAPAAGVPATVAAASLPAAVGRASSPRRRPPFRSTHRSAGPTGRTRNAAGTRGPTACAAFGRVASAAAGATARAAAAAAGATLPDGACRAARRRTASPRAAALQGAQCGNRYERSHRVRSANDQRPPSLRHILQDALLFCSGGRRQRRHAWRPEYRTTTGRRT